MKSINVEINGNFSSLSFDFKYEFDSGITTLLGHIGSGKSTIVDSISGFNRQIKSIVNINGDVFDSHIPSKINLRPISVMFQDARLIPHMNVKENISFALEIMGNLPEEIETKTNTLLDLVELNDCAFKHPGQLSGGEQTRAIIARALANNPVVLLCDEPTGNLDPDLSIQIVSLLEKINRAGTTVLMATHDSSIVNRRKKRIIELKDGKVKRDELNGSYVVR